MKEKKKKKELKEKKKKKSFPLQIGSSCASPSLCLHARHSSASL
jgi:hypothetical protein